ncbi:MAG: hypothetical protein JSU81_11425 [Candidatus Coatesbacteria bacterium]|nr:MAG: hypothetical protein JSU81_11425 [Candidatus Coatesbacteria bacterium]
MTPEVLISTDRREDDRYHQPKCRWCDHIHRANKQLVTIAEAEEKGYKACDECRPGG